MAKLRILMAAPTPFPGNRGTPSRILDMSQGLSRLGHEVHVVSYHLKTDTPTDGIHIHRIPNIWTYKKMGPGPSIQKLFLLDPLLLLKIMEITRKISLDMIHGHSFEGFLTAYLAAKKFKKKIIYDAHSTLVDELPTYNFINFQPLANYLDRAVPKLANHVIAVSDTLKEFLLKNNVAKEKITVVPTGVRISQFQGQEPEWIRKRYNIEADKKIVMYTGSLANFQGIDYLMAAMHTVFQKCEGAILFLVGNSNEEKYKRVAIERKIAERVIITGDQPFERIPLFLAAADVVVSPRTVCPGIPQKLSNYMAAKKAIVSFEGSAKLLLHGENGLVVTNGDTNMMAEAILKLIENEPLRRRLGENAKKSLIGKFDWDFLVRKVEETYARILEDRANP